MAIIFTIAIFELIAHSSVKYFHETQKTQYIYYFIAIICYGIVSYLLSMSYEHKGIGVINLIWSGVSITVILTAGMLLYGEKPTIYDIIGMCLIISGISIIIYDKKYV